MRVAILGAGNWGTTLAIVLSRQGHEVSLWEYDRAQAGLIAATRHNEKFLPGHRLPEAVEVTADMDDAVSAARVVLIAVPAQRCRNVLKALREKLRNSVIVSMMKGIECESRKRISEIAAEEIPGFSSEQFAVISGPTIAVEVVLGLPTSAVVAATSRETAMMIQKQFSSRNLRLYTSDDVPGVELAGALKNVIALAAGVCDGMGLGYNTKGSLLTRGLAEISRLGEAIGGRRQTFSGLSGMGDLITTCTSPHSRNRTFGERIGRGEKVDEILSSMVMVAEGVWTADAAAHLAREHQVNMPITDAVRRILSEGQDPKHAVGELMQRSLKAED